MERTEVERFRGWFNGSAADVVFSRAKVTALLGLCARSTLVHPLKEELHIHGEGYLIAALTLADMAHIDVVQCGALLEHVLFDNPVTVVHELSGLAVDDEMIEVLRKLTPLSPPVRESYLDVLDKLRADQARRLLMDSPELCGTASWMMFEFPKFLLRSDVLLVLDGAFNAPWPIVISRPDYEVADLMDDIRGIALTIEGDPSREEAFGNALACASGPRALARIVRGWRKYACTIKSLRATLRLNDADV